MLLAEALLRDSDNFRLRRRPPWMTDAAVQPNSRITVSLFSGSRRRLWLSSGTASAVLVFQGEQQQSPGGLLGSSSRRRCLASSSFEEWRSAMRRNPARTVVHAGSCKSALRRRYLVMLSWPAVRTILFLRWPWAACSILIPQRPSLELAVLPIKTRAALYFPVQLFPEPCRIPMCSGWLSLTSPPISLLLPSS